MFEDPQRTFKDPWRSSKILARFLRILARFLRILARFLRICKDLGNVFWGSSLRSLRGSLKIFMRIFEDPQRSLQDFHQGWPLWCPCSALPVEQSGHLGAGRYVGPLYVGRCGDRRWQYRNLTCIWNAVEWIFWSFSFFRYLDWKWSSGWLESWEALLLATNILTTNKAESQSILCLVFKWCWAMLLLRSPFCK